MKTRRLAIWAVGATVALLAVLAAPAQNTATQPAVRETKPAPPPAKASPSATPAPTAPNNQPLVAQTPAVPQLSPWAEEMVKLAHAAIDENVMLSFVDNAAGTFNLASDHIIYLRDVGIPDDVITAMMQHDADIASGLRPLLASTVATTPRDIQLFLASAKAHAATNAPAKPAPAPPAQVAPPAPPQEFAALDFPGLWTEPEPGPDLAQPAKLYPVREPYPVQLTDPILVVPGQGRVPNVFILQMFR